jgi:hypothetical protein
MLGLVGDGDRVVYEQHGDATFDAIGPPQSRVVERLVTYEQEWAAIFWTDQDASQLRGQHAG